ncbi:MAG: DegT/DnrJ/EryC1/StrS family aminotransferase [Chryseotalea sp. WA131a]|jgi:dTDP-4-amino-4,6-dideoxygalactose transaminase|nr:MAG: DegT/DnrJ/EryC1/StrS family aminotransferase [Chryseotalea sp. WA131a]
MNMIPLIKPFVAPPEELMPALQDVLYSGYIAEGEKVKQFEELFGSYIGNPYCLALNSGTAALHIALILAGVKPEDEVISTAMTAEPTNVAIMQAGAKVVWADVDPATGLISPQSIRSKISKKTKAIMIVHYAGMVAQLDEIQKIANQFNLPIIEDAAHALGAVYQGNRVGSISDYTIFSLQAIKHITTVDGGMLCVKTKENWDKGRLIRWFGLDKTKSRLENNIKLIGYKYHMNNVNATIGIVQMKFVKRVIDAYIQNGKFFDEQLQGISGVSLINYYPHTQPSYWLYTLFVERRSDFCRYMSENGVMSSELHMRNDNHMIFNYAKTKLEGLDSFYERFVHLPCGFWLTEEDKSKIVRLIKNGW